MKDLIVRNLTVSAGEFNGEIKLKWDTVTGAELYVIQVLCAPDTGKSSKWKVCDIIKGSHYAVSGLNTNKKYFFRVAAVNKKKQGPFSSKAELKLIYS